MALYNDAAFTITSTPMPDEPAPAVGIDETGQADELQAVGDVYREALAGPLRLNCEDTGLTLTVSIEGADDCPTAIDWGDGTREDLIQKHAEHTYRLPGPYTVTASATVDGTDYQVAKLRDMGSS